MLKLISISATKTEKSRTDGKISRQYYTATFGDSENPFAASVIRNIFQSHVGDEGKTAIWRGGNPSEVAQFIGKTIPGAIVTKLVVPYTIGEKTVNKYTTVVYFNEDVATVFKSCGHPLVENAVVATPSVKLNAAHADMN